MNDEDKTVKVWAWDRDNNRLLIPSKGPMEVDISPQAITTFKIAEDWPQEKEQYVQTMTIRHPDGDVEFTGFLEFIRQTPFDEVVLISFWSGGNSQVKKEVVRLKRNKHGNFIT